MDLFTLQTPHCKKILSLLPLKCPRQLLVVVLGFVLPLFLSCSIISPPQPSPWELWSAIWWQQSFSCCWGCLSGCFSANCLGNRFYDGLFKALLQGMDQFIRIDHSLWQPFSCFSFSVPFCLWRSLVHLLNPYTLLKQKNVTGRKAKPHLFPDMFPFYCARSVCCCCGAFGCASLSSLRTELSLLKEKLGSIECINWS